MVEKFPLMQSNVWIFIELQMIDTYIVEICFRFVKSYAGENFPPFLVNHFTLIRKEEEITGMVYLETGKQVEHFVAKQHIFL